MSEHDDLVAAYNTVVSKARFNLRQKRYPIRVPITPAHSKEERRSLLLINLVEPLLEHRQLVLLQQKESSSKLIETSTQKEAIISRHECSETGISRSVILNQAWLAYHFARGEVVGACFGLPLISGGRFRGVPTWKRGSGGCHLPVAVSSKERKKPIAGDKNNLFLLSGRDQSPVNYLDDLRNWPHDQDAMDAARNVERGYIYSDKRPHNHQSLVVSLNLTQISWPTLQYVRF